MVDVEMLEKTSKTISTIANLWSVKAIIDKRAATVEVDTFVSPVDRLSIRSLTCICPKLSGTS